MKTFEQENNELLKSVIDNLYIKTFKKDWKNLSKSEQHITLELYITPECNQNCSYCYLQKFKDDIYPPHLVDNKKILKNLEILLSYCIENSLKPFNLDIFSGEIWDTDFGIEVLELILTYIKKGFRTNKIMIPSNFSFILDDKYANKIEELRLDYEKYGDVSLKFSCSNDGYFIDKETRPFYDTERTDLKGTEEYYNKLFDYCKRNRYAFHPMVSAHGIEYWKENFKWWMETLQKYDLSPYHFIMFLETRNDDWTEEKIISYLEYVDYAFDWYRQSFNDDKEFLNFLLSRANGKTKMKYHYTPVRIGRYSSLQACSISRALCVRLGDLAIAPCHRTSYDELLLGRFIVKNNKIVDIEAKNIQMMNLIWFTDHHCEAKCNNCPINKYCMRGCYGAQYENMKDVLHPCDSVCNLFWAKWVFLYYKYKKTLKTNEQEIKDFISTMESLSEREEFKKWITIIQSKF